MVNAETVAPVRCVLEIRLLDNEDPSLNKNVFDGLGSLLLVVQLQKENIAVLVLDNRHNRCHAVLGRDAPQHQILASMVCLQDKVIDGSLGELAKGSYARGVRRWNERACDIAHRGIEMSCILHGPKSELEDGLFARLSPWRPLAHTRLGISKILLLLLQMLKILRSVRDVVRIHGV